MQKLPVLGIVIFLLPACSSPQLLTAMSYSFETSAPIPQSKTIPMASNSAQSQMGFNLSDHQWQHRTLLIFAPSEQSSAYQQQTQQWESHTEEMRDRDLKLVKVLATGASRVDGQLMTVASANRLRDRFGVAPEDFAVILVGKDGTEKQRSPEPVDPAAIFSVIDAMPMRQQEMRDRK